MGPEESKQHFPEVERKHARVGGHSCPLRLVKNKGQRSQRELIPLTRVAGIHPLRLCRSCLV
jgi:hypothetical protein